jgi:segregation and condensation protein B
MNPKAIIEALLFSSSEPLPLSKIKEVLEDSFSLKELESLILELNQEYLKNDKPYHIVNIAEGYILRTKKEYAPYLDKLFRRKKTDKLSHAAAEVLAIIAYKQPITRARIDEIRGVDSSGILANLMDRELIQVVGKEEVVGRPSLYGVTKQFLQHFGLSSIQELPKLEEME